MKHAIIVHGPPLSGKTTWIKEAGFKFAVDLSVLPIPGLFALFQSSECHIPIVCIECHEVSPETVEKLEHAGFSVSFRRFPQGFNQ